MLLWMIICVIYLLLIGIDLPSLKQAKSKKIIVIYVLLIIAAFAITGAKQAGIKVPGPSIFIKNIVDKIIGA